MAGSGGGPAAARVRRRALAGHASRLRHQPAARSGRRSTTTCSAPAWCCSTARARATHSRRGWPRCARAAVRSPRSTTISRISPLWAARSMSSRGLGIPDATPMNVHESLKAPTRTSRTSGGRTPSAIRIALAAIARLFGVDRAGSGDARACSRSAAATARTCCRWRSPMPRAPVHRLRLLDAADVARARHRGRPRTRERRAGRGRPARGRRRRSGPTTTSSRTASTPGCRRTCATRSFRARRARASRPAGSST